ncbi:MBOAT family O-acyltransferase [Pseudomonadota bacterium]
MLFSSTVFLFLFLPAILIAYRLVAKFPRVKNYILLFASLFFYAWGENVYVLIMIFSIFVNYMTGMYIHKFEDNQGLKKLTLAVGIVLNLLLLGYFKYANFVVENVNDLMLAFGLPVIESKEVHLPIGISFFTFQALSYIIDVYKKITPVQRNPFNLALYISLFPQLIAGPIVRYDTVDEQITNRSSSIEDIANGIRRFIIGLGKKVIIANPMGEIADIAFSTDMGDMTYTIAWIGIVCYSLQIFFDFCGYSDMAIGLGRIFGFTFPENFNFPYISKNIREFWRRWHISLSMWLRDYLYIPLGGNRISEMRTYVNLIIVFLLCGLWHGASWTFIIWGIYHGFFLVIERMKFGEILKNSYAGIQHFYTIFVFMIGWVFFRSDTFSYGVGYLVSMFNFVGSPELTGEVYRAITNNYNLMALGLGILLSTPIVRWMKEKYILKFQATEGRTIDAVKTILILLGDFWLMIILLWSIVRVGAGTHNPFIYFRF